MNADKGKQVVNLTPHTITVRDENGKVLAEYPASGREARVNTRVATGSDGVDTIEYLAPQAPPKPKAGTIYVVSTLYAMAYNREDLRVVNGLIRDDQGRIIGCLGLAKLTHSSGDV